MIHLARMNNLTTRVISGSILILAMIALYLLQSSHMTLVVYLFITSIILGEISVNIKYSAPAKIQLIAYTYTLIPTLLMIYTCIRNTYPTTHDMFCMSVLCAFTFDTCAYVGGRIIGGHKIAPNISPSKTIAGVITGLLGVMLVLLHTTHYCIHKKIILSIVLASGAFYGDLLQSKFKRVIGIKDMGRLIPGHGGFGDRFDGVLGVLILYSILCITGYIH